ncbi:hypothetical protein [Phycicoccus sonneratiae]|uniref:Uncharacterized protein n=1 Tax=Phycicoccus sonneratiae TaxID=2807628 RepID=A0ABS2CQ55_9MICO|nr:hypothetical protein [Phycicoccus sonneraticus]MBM6402017.1 hypothetical protein [Phycicoccus sonneraticus]
MEGMKPLEPMHVDVGVYCRLLAQQLRLAGLPEGRVVEVVHDVLDHVRATGEDPVEAFGQPADYAARWVEPPTVWDVLRHLAVQGVAACAMFGAMPALVTGGSWTRDVGVTLDDALGTVPFVVVVAVLPWTLDLWLTRRAARSAGRRSAVPDWVVRGAVIVALMVLFGWGMSLLPDHGPESPTLLDAPRWLYVSVGVAGACVLFRQDRGQSSGLPAAPGPRRSRWSRLRRFLTDPDSNARS